VVDNSRTVASDNLSARSHVSPANEKIALDMQVRTAVCRAVCTKTNSLTCGTCHLARPTHSILPVLLCHLYDERYFYVSESFEQIGKFCQSPRITQNDSVLWNWWDKFVHRFWMLWMNDVLLYNRLW
jgi:hypothetical protein